MNARQLADWILSLPEDVQNSPVEGWIQSSSWPLVAKRVVAYRWKDGSGGGIAINPAGTHYAEEFFTKDADAVSCIGLNGDIQTPTTPEPKP